MEHSISPYGMHHSRLTCPGPGATRLALLRRAGTHNVTLMDPGSAAHRAARAARCAASGARRNYSAAICLGAGGGLARSAANCAYLAFASRTDFSFTGP